MAFLYMGLIIAAVLLGVCLWPLPNPLGAVPRKSSARTRLQHCLEIARWVTEHGSVLTWVANQATDCRSGIAQMFLLPWCPSSIVLLDYGEAMDVLEKRQNEFEISDLRKSIFSGLSKFYQILATQSIKIADRWRRSAGSWNRPRLLRPEIQACPTAHS